MEQNQFDIKKVQVHRTTEGTVFEVAFVILAIIVWGLIIWMIHRAPDIVPTHFDASGKPNAYGSPTGLLIPINMPFKITNIRQVELAIRFSRVMGITFLLIPLSVAYMMLGMSSPSPIPILVVIGLLLLEITFFSIVIYKAK